MGFFNQLGSILSYDNHAYDILINYSMLTLSSLTLWLDARISLLTTSQRRQWWISFVGVVTFQIGLCYAVECVGISIIWNAQLGWLLLRTMTRARSMIRQNSSSITADTADTDTEVEDSSRVQGNAHTSFNPHEEAPRDMQTPHVRRSTLVQAAAHGVKEQMQLSGFYTYSKGSFLIGLAVNGYYLLTEDIITTVAHVCAVVLGMLLAAIDLKMHPLSGQDGSSSPSDPLLEATESLSAC